ncbi:MAG: hypothetical protein QOH13_621, partial [Thermoleophilaceae bacterium]|nr:hypothetical protein [Thermoleophilaceae bacterium]
ADAMVDLPAGRTRLADVLDDRGIALTELPC